MGTRRRTASARGTSATWVWWDARHARRKGPEAIRQRERLAELVAFAREHSAYYRRLYQKLPERIEDVTSLPKTDKRQLMDHFDEVVTDPAVTLVALREFVADPARTGERFAGKCLVATTAGTRGVFVLDDRYRAVTSGLVARLSTGWLFGRETARLVVRGGRFAAVVATGGHFLAVATGTREMRERPRRHRRLRILSSHRPLPELVAELNAFGPLMLRAASTAQAALARKGSLS